MPGKPSPRRPLPPPADVLSGRVLTDAETLVAMIRACNPTGRDVPPEERRRRYLRKARLQSLLARRFPDGLALQRDPGRRGIVLLEHRGRSAGHAPLDSLDEDVRSWVQRRLDEGEVAEHARPVQAGRPAAPAPRTSRRREAPPTLPADPLRAGAAALLAFDYDRARASFYRALDEATPERRVPAARALLTLLIDELGDDAAALALDGRLPEEAQADSDVRLLLAHAAARTAAGRRSAELVGDLPGRRAVAVHLLLCDAALGSGDLAGADAAVERARLLDPAEPGVTERSERIRAARAAERRPLEAELERLLGAGALEAAEAAARALLVRWPDCAAARTALGSVTASRRRTEIEALRQAGEAALREGRPAAAIGPLSEALRRAASAQQRDRLRALLAEADQAQQREQAAARQATALRRLAGPEVGSGLVCYLALPPSGRAAVRERAAGEVCRWLDWLDEMHRARPDAAPRALADAALALVEAEAAVDPEAALGGLRGHERLLQPLPGYQRLAAAAQERQRTRREADARGRLAAVRAARQGGGAEDLVRAQALLAGLELHLLGEDERREAEALLVALEARRERHDLEVRLRHLRGTEAGGDLAGLLEARDLARRLGSGAQGAEGARWTDEAAALGAALRRAFRVRVSTGGAGTADAGVPIGTEAAAEQHRSPDIDGLVCSSDEASSGRWLVPGADEFLLLTVLRHRIFLSRVDASGAVRLRLRLVAPAPIRLLTDEIQPDGLWIYGAGGMLLRLSLPAGDVLRYHPPGEVLREGEKLTSAQLAPGSRFLWLGTEREGRPGPEVRVLDLERPRSVLRLGALPFIRAAGPVPGDVMVGAAALGDAVTTFDPAGRPLRRTPLPVKARVRDAAAHPTGAGLLLLLEPAAEGPGALACLTVRPDGTAGPLLPLAETRPTGVCHLAVDRDAGLAFVRCAAPDGELLLCLHAAGDDGTLREGYRVALRDGVLMHDGVSQRVAMAWMSPGGLRLTRLGAAPPLLVQAVPRRTLNFLGTERCWPEIDVPADWPIVRFGRSMARTPPAERVGAIVQSIRLHGADSTVVVEVDSFLRQQGYESDAREISRDVLRTHDTPALRLVVANHEAQQGGWSEVARLLSDAAPDAAGSEARARHLHHLLGLALLQQGALDEAEAALRGGLARTGDCPLETLLELVAALREPPDLDDEDDAHPVRRLVRAVRRADRHSERGDVAAACGALDVPLVWLEDEVQSLARLCAARLALPAPADEAGRFHVALTLATFLNAHSSDPRSDLPLGERWDQARLDELAERAEAWLAADEERWQP